MGADIMHRITCPHCHQRYRIPDNRMGKTVRCARCLKPFQLVEDVAYWRDAVTQAAERYGDAATAQPEA